MRRFLVLNLLLGAVTVVMLTGAAPDSTARQATPLPEAQIRPVIATAEALDVPPTVWSR